jgi:hypothetical protein
MKLTHEQSQRLLKERGIWITEACDKRGRLLGSVRWTRRGEPGEWCSRECRDGIVRKRIGARPAGRPRKHANNAAKQRSYRNRPRNGLDVTKYSSELTENARLADAKNGSHVVSPLPHRFSR